jgi:spore germination cell wall hydrolase CwlJ-like protein
MGDTLMKKITLLLSTFLISACATTSEPALLSSSNVTAYQQSLNTEYREVPSNSNYSLYFDKEDLGWYYKTVYGEVRNQSDTEVKAVCQVIYNRLQSGIWGNSFRDVVLAPKQFSVWNKNDKQRRYLLSTRYYDTPNYDRVVSLCNGVLNERLRGVDHSNGINHFYHPAGMKSSCVKYKKFNKKKRKFKCTRWRKLPPHWAYSYDHKVRIGSGVFFNKKEYAR